MVIEWRSMMYKIHTVTILRNEIKMYNAFKHEHDKLIQSYVKPLRELYLKLFEIEQKLILIKSPGKGNGLGGYVQESDQRFNDLIQKKEDISLKMIEYVMANRSQFLEEVEEWNRRIATVEYYLSKLDDEDKEFINDLYVDHNMKFKVIMEKYGIKNETHVYRKAKNILKKVL